MGRRSSQRGALVEVELDIDAVLEWADGVALDDRQLALRDGPVLRGILERARAVSLAVMADWAIRPASMADVEAVAELRAMVLREDLERLGRFDEQRVRQRLRDGFEPAYTWVIEVGGVLAGSVSLRPAEGAHWLEHFYLAPCLQGRGIGGTVLRGLLERCDRAGTVVRLNVLQGSAARRLYERHGFTLETEDSVDVFMVREPAAVERVPR